MVKFSALINTLFLKAQSLVRHKQPQGFLSDFSHIEQTLEAKLAEPFQQKPLPQHFFRKILRLIHKILRLIAHFLLHFPILSRPLKKVAGFAIKKRIFKRKLTYVVILVLIVVIIKLPWPLIIDRTIGFISYLITLGNPVKIEEPVTIFKTTDDPKFSLSIPQKSDKGIGKSAENKWVEGDEIVSAEAIHKGTNRKQPVQIKKNKEGKFDITLSKKNNHFLPGEYTLRVSSKESFIYTRNIDQVFSWGVLAINTNKSIFTPGEEAKLSMGVIDDKGHTICDGKLTLKITDPKGKEELLTSQNGKIRQSGLCHGDSFVEVADYQALYRTGEAGTYQMDFTALTKNGSQNIKDTFEVRDSVPFEIERAQFPSRIYPPEIYPVILTVKANQDFKGKIVDTVPSAFETKCRRGIFGQKGLEFDEGKNIPKCEINYAEGVKGLVWDADLKKGETITLYYTIKFPDVSPEFYLLGPLRIIDEQSAKAALDNFGTLAINPNLQKDEPNPPYNALFEEARQWQVASDATTAIEQQINILNQAYSITSTATTGMPNDNSLGLICYRNNATANTECQNSSADTTIDGAYTSATVYFEADIKNSTGATTYAGLYDSNGNLVTNSTVSTDSLTYTRVRSEAITSNLTSGTNYTARIYTSDANSTGSIIAARLIILQSTTSTFADTQTIAEVGANETTTSTSMAALTNPKYFQYDNSKYDGTKTAYFEATLKGGSIAAVPGSPGTAGPVSTGAGANDVVNTGCDGTADETDPETVDDWVNPGNITTSNDSRAVAFANATVAANLTSDCLLATNFDFSSVPSTATVNGILVEIEKSESAANDNVLDNSIQIISAGTPTGNDKASASEWVAVASEGYVSYPTSGASTDTWGISNLTGADLTNDTNWGVKIQAKTSAAGGSSVNANVDHVRMTIYYTTAATPASSATAYAQLYNRTNGVAVTGSSISTSNTTWTLVRSDVLTTNWDTSNADEYEMQFKTDNSAAAAGVANAKIVIAQNNGTGITKLQTYHNYINNVQTQNAASIGTFSTTSQAQLLRINSQNTSLTYNIGPSTYLYVLGGVSGSTVSTVYRSTINYNTRDAGTFATTSQRQLLTLLRDSSGFISTVGSSSYLYVVGGFEAASRSTVYKATINSINGNLDQVFATTSQKQLPATVDRLQSVNTTIASGSTYVYVLGGTSGTTAHSTIYKSTLNSTTGDIDQPFLTTSQKQLLLTTLRHTATLATIGSSTYIYVIGGEDNATTSYSTVYKSLINAGSGDIDAVFATTSQAQFPFQQEMHSTIAATVGPSTYLYVLGGSSPTETLTSIYKATLDTTTGNVGSFNTTGQGSLGKINRLFSTATSSFGGSNYVYIIGGFDGTSLTYSTVYKSVLSNDFDSFGFFNLFDPNNWQGGTFTYNHEGTIQPTTYGTTGTARLTPGGQGRISTSGTLTVTGSGDAGTFATTSQAQLLQAITDQNTITSTIGSSTYVYVLGGNTVTNMSTNYKSTLNSTSGDLGAFATTSQKQLPQAIGYQNTITSTIGSSTYVYVLGGSNAGEASISTVYKSTLNSTSGDLGAFATTSQGQLLQGIRTQNTITSTIGSSTYVYALGGYDTGVSSQVSTVYKSTLNSTSGDLGAFATTSQAQLLQKLYFQNTITLTIGSSTYVYVLGGSTATNISTNYKSTLNSTSGDLGAFATTSQAQLPEAIGYQNTITSTIGSSTYVYVLGGNSGFRSTVYKSTLNSTSGDLGAFATTSQGQLLQGISGQNTITSTIGSSTYVYALGGADSTAARKSTVYKSTLSTSASVAFERKRSQAENLETLQGANQPFSSTSQGQLPALLTGHSTILARTGGINYLYVLGGSNSSTGSTLYRSLIDANTNAGGFATTNQAQLSQVSQNQDAFVFRNPLNTNFLFALGGSNSSIYSTVYRSILNSSDGTTGSFATTGQGQLPQGLRSLSLATVTKPANYLYVVGGCNTAACGSGSSVSTVYKATISIPADLGTFETTSQGQLPAIRGLHTTITSTAGPSTYVYTLGGTPDQGVNLTSTVYKSTINTNTGNLGTFATTSQGQLSVKIMHFTAITSTAGPSTYVYVVGGDNGVGFTSTVYKSTINTNTGDLGTFATTNQGQLPTLRGIHTTITFTAGSSTYVYVLGGTDGTVRSTVYKSTINSTSGDMGGFATTSQGQLPGARSNFTTQTSTAGSSTYVYVVGGSDNSSWISTNYKANLNSITGDLGTFATTSQGQLPAIRGQHTTITSTAGPSTYVYVVGGCNLSCADYTSTVFKANLNSITGDLGTFATTSQGQLPGARIKPTSITSTAGPSTYVYVVGGIDGAGSTTSTVYKSTLDTSANLSTFATTSQTQVDTGIVEHKTVSTSLSGTSYLYTIGGFNPTAHTVTGVAGTFATTDQGQLQKDLERSYAVTTTIGSSTYVYVIGGNGTVAGRSSSNYKATINNTSGDVGLFSTTSQAQLLATQHAHAAIIVIPSSYYLYVIGGSQAGSMSSVYRSVIDSTTGDLGSFTTTSQGQMQVPLNGRPGVASTTVGSSTYIYVMGGCNLCNASLSTLYKSTVNPTTGNVSTFDTTSQIQLPEAREFNTAYATTIGSSSYLYVIGGCTDTCSTANSSILYKSTLNGTTGNVGSFATTSQGQIPSNLYRHVSVVSTIGSSSYLYLIGGCTAGLCTTVASTVYKATIDSNNGNISTFATTNQSQLPILLEFSPMGIAYNPSDQGYLYVLGGANSSGASVSTVYKSMSNITNITGTTISTVYKSTVDSNANAITFSTTSQSQLPSLLHDHAAVLTKVGETNYIYVLGGCNGTSLSCSFTNAGEVGSFATTSQAQLPGIRAYSTTTASTIGSSTYLYVLGGWNGSVGYFTTLYKSTLDATTGDTGTFATTSQGQLPNFRIYHTTTASTIGSSTYLYAIGGYDSSNYISTVYKANINSTSGDTGTFATTSQAQLPGLIGVHTTTALTIGSSTYLYVIGGFKTGTTFSTNYKATINATTGDIGAFNTTSQTQLPASTAIHTTAALTIGSSTYLYVLGGWNGTSYLSTLYKSTLNATTGDIGTFATTSQGQLPNEIGYFSTTASTIGSSTYLYAIGGYDGSSYFSTVYKSTINATTGDAGTFATTVQAQLPALIGYHNTAASTIGSSTYLYVLGGKDGTFADSTNYKATLSGSGTDPGNSVYRSQIDSSANAGSFSQTNMGQLPTDITAHTVSAAKLGPSTYLYVIGGCNGASCGSKLSTVYKSNILNSEYDEELQNAKVTSGWLVITFSPTPTANAVQVLIKGGTVIRGGTKLGR